MGSPVVEALEVGLLIVVESNETGICPAIWQFKGDVPDG